jgi:hypothetical protein
VTEAHPWLAPTEDVRHHVLARARRHEEIEVSLLVGSVSNQDCHLEAKFEPPRPNGKQNLAPLTPRLS